MAASYRLIACDLDDTLADSKRPIDEIMAAILLKLLKNYDLCVISGGTYEQIKRNVIDRMELPDELLSRIHVISTSGARYDRYDFESKTWKKIYQKIMSDDERRYIAHVIETEVKQIGFWEDGVSGERIEDRQTQVTFSGLGQLASPEAKAAWDPTREKRNKIWDVLSEALPGYEIAINGKTSVDVLQLGVDKGFGIAALMEIQGYGLEEILFIGDSLEEHGNDYPVKQMGIATVKVGKWQDTASYMIENIL
jgi:phosphomannomutase